MPFDFTEYGLGWDAGGEAAHAGTLSSMCLAPSPVTKPIPDEVDPQLPVNDQRRRNSCCGNALDKCLEFDHLFETGEYINLSARFSYLIAKTVDVQNGNGSMIQDAGATIGAAAIAAQQMGACREEDLPYWRDDEQFDPQIPRTALEVGKQHLAEGWCEVPEIDFGIDLIGSGQCGCIFGIPWYDSMAAYDGSEEVITSVSGTVLGGHALCWPAYKTISGDRLPKIWNSHSERWGRNGTAVLSRKLFWWLIGQGGFGVRGVKRTPAFVERPIEKFIGIR